MPGLCDHGQHGDPAIQQLHHGAGPPPYRTGKPAGSAAAIGADHRTGDAFPLIQLYEYEELIGVFAETFDGRPFTGHAFATTLFTLTGFHGAHVLVGLIYLACIFVAAWRGRYGAQNFVAVDIAALFRHFVDWICVAVFTSVYPI